MGWIDKLMSNNSSSEPGSNYYPSRTYKKVLCSRQHCTDDCNRPRTDPFKFWALFFCQDKIDHSDLFMNISNMPDKLRFTVYLKCLGLKEFPENIDMKDEDSELAQYIFQIADKKYQEEEIFEIYKALEFDFQIDIKLIKLIFEFYKLYGSHKVGIYSILYELLKNHGLIEAFEYDKEEYIGEKKSKSKIKGEENMNEWNVGDRHKKLENINQSETEESRNGLKEFPSNNNEALKNKPFDPSNNENERSQGNDNNFEEESELSKKTLNKIWKIILEEKFDIFYQLTDLIVSLKNPSYKELINRASEFSLYTSSNKLITVLAAKGNNHYYKKDYAKQPLEKKNLKEPTYFDFLVVQNEIIKAQENYKKDMERKIEMLEDYNIKLKFENEEFRNTIENFKMKEKG